MKLIKTHGGRKPMFDVILSGRERVVRCPFCHGVARLEHTWTAHYWFECIDCGAQVGDDKSGRNAHNGHAHLASARRALLIWNTRA